MSLSFFSYDSPAILLFSYHIDMGDTEEVAGIKGQWVMVWERGFLILCIHPFLMQLHSELLTLIHDKITFPLSSIIVLKAI